MNGSDWVVLAGGGGCEPADGHETFRQRMTSLLNLQLLCRLAPIYCSLKLFCCALYSPINNGVSPVSAV